MIFKNIIINFIKELKYWNIYFHNKYSFNSILNNKIVKLIHIEYNNFMYFILKIELVLINWNYTDFYNITKTVNYNYNINDTKLIKIKKILKNTINSINSNIIIYFRILTINIKWLLLATIISLLYFFISLFYIQIDFTKQIALWYILLIAYYLLMSTFNTFLNKYRYGKFTSAINRFWKRTGTVFWLLEGFLFLLFFYYYINSSQEPLYMFDFSSLNQEFLIQLKSSYKNLILLSLAVYLGFLLLLNINYYLFYQNIIILFLITLIVFFTLYIESYQFVYILTIFADKEWLFDEFEQLWVLEVEQNNLRVKQQYFVLCLVAKYWHFIFIFISWFFFLIKSLEVNNITITLLGYNIQNLLILYLLNLLCLIQWGKFIFKKFFDITYYWFYIQYDEKFFINFILEIWKSIISFISINDLTFPFEIYNISITIFFLDDLILWKYI